MIFVIFIHFIFSFKVFANNSDYIFISSVVDIVGKGREEFKFHIDKDATFPISLKLNDARSSYEGCFEKCNIRTSPLQKVLTIKDGKVLETLEQFNELLGLYPFFNKTKKLKHIETIFSHREHPTKDFRSGSVIYSFSDDYGQRTDFHTEWVLAKNIFENEFSPKVKRKDIGFFSDFNTRTTGNVIQRFSLKGFPLPVLVINDNSSAEFSSALDQGVNNWNNLLKDYFPGGVFQKPKVLSVKDFLKEQSFLGNEGGVVINTVAVDELKYTGHAQNFSHPETNEIFGVRIWLNLPRMEKSVDAVIERCEKSKMNLPYSEPWESLGDCSLDRKTRVIGAFRSTLTHELGHALGLTHNLKGSIGAKQGSISSSHMDYSHRADRPYMKLGPYDRLAILWGYFDISPVEKIPYCYDDDGDIWDETFFIKDPQCSGDDKGIDSFGYFEKNWFNLIELGLGDGINPPLYLYKDLQDGFKQSLRAFGQYIASADSFGENHINFYGSSSRPRDSSEISQFITNMLEDSLCRKSDNSHFIELLRKETDVILNDYSKLDLKLSCLK